MTTATERSAVVRDYDQRQRRLDTFLSLMMATLEHGKRCTDIPRLTLWEMADTVYERLRDADAKLRSDLDDVGMIHIHEPLDLDPLGAFIERLEKDGL